MRAQGVTENFGIFESGRESIPRVGIRYFVPREAALAPLGNDVSHPGPGSGPDRGPLRRAVCLTIQ